MNDQEEEIFDLVDAHDRVIGRVSRSEVHGNPRLIHRVAHVLVFNRAGKLFLQKRSTRKDVQPGKWDTSVGGHVDSGETYEAAATREMAEELGITGTTPRFLYKYLHSNPYESEYVATYLVSFDGSIQLDPKEIDEGRFWELGEIGESAAKGIFTPNFLDEMDRYAAYSGPTSKRE